MRLRTITAQAIALVLLVGVAFVIPSRDICTTEKKEVIVRGDSMAGIINEGEKVLLETDYYECNEVKKYDVVAYQYAGNREPVIKMIRAVPGDHFLIESFQDRGYIIRLNGRILLTSENTPYLFTKEKARVLQLYQESYKGVIPEESYLILGNVASGSVDSSRFGLVHKSDIIGRITYLQE